MRFRRPAQILLLFLAASGLSVLAAELFLRRYFPVNPVVYELDDACLYRLVPGSTKIFRHFRVHHREGVVVKINSHGFRGDEFVLGTHDLRRIVVYGDSFIEAEFTKLEDTFTKRLEAKLNHEPGAPFEVLNAGVAGYGPDQIGVRLEKELDALAPDLVIVAICAGNDFGDLLRNKIYRLGEDHGLVKNRFVLARSLRSHLARMGDGAARRGMLVQALLQLRLALTQGFIERPELPPQTEGEDPVAWSLRACRFEYEDYVLKGNNTVVDLLFDHYDADVSLLPDSEAARYKVDLMEQVLGRIKRTVDSRGVPLLLMIIPDAIDVCPDHHFQVKAETLMGHSPSRPTDVLEAIALRSGMPFVNLFGTFRNANPSHLYFQDPETHWNEAGQELAAGAVAQTLLSTGMLPPGPKSAH